MGLNVFDKFQSIAVQTVPSLASQDPSTLAPECLGEARWFLIASFVV